MTSFDDMGLREELLRTLEDEDFIAPTDVQKSLIPALRRGGNVVARASSGSGKTLAYTLGILDRLALTGESESDEAAPAEADLEAEAPKLRMLVLVPVTGEAERIAVSMVPYAQSVGMHIGVPGAGWGTGPREAAILIAPVGEVMRAIRGSEIDLDGIEAIVVDGASAMLDLADWEQVDALVDLVPRDAQRVIFSAALSEPIEDLIARRVKRALRYPAEPAVPNARKPVTPEGSIGFVLASDRGKFELLTRQLAGSDSSGSPPPVIYCRSDERSADLAEKLALRGFLIGSPDDPDADAALVAAPAPTDELEGEAGQTISYDVPPDASELKARHGRDPDAIVLLHPRELAHLHEIATQARFDARSAPTRETSAADPALERFRDDLREAIQQEDLTAQMLVLEPLFAEFTAEEIAAAASARLRSRRPLPAEAAAPAPSPSRHAQETSVDAGPVPVTWARLFVSIGSREDIRPGDLVGTLAGEANIPGSRLGKIEIRDSFSIVEVQADVADKVIRAVNGTTMKGRSLRVDYDRGGPARRPPPRRDGGARRTERRPPREGR